MSTNLPLHNAVLRIQRLRPDGRTVAVPGMAAGPLLGRETEIEQVATALRSGQKVLLQGAAGNGSSALAAEVITQLNAAKVYRDGTLWLSDIGTTSVLAIADAIARALGDLPALHIGANGRSGVLRNVLSEHQLLIVLDGLTDLSPVKPFISDYLPGTIGLLATAGQPSSSFDLNLEVRTLARPAATALFRKQAQVQSIVLPATDAPLAAICEIVQDQPLALVIAAGCVGQKGVTVETLPQRLAEKADPRSPAWAALHLAADALNAEQRRVFTRLAASFGNSLGLELLASLCEMPASKCERYLGQLITRGLVRRDKDRFSLHPLVKEFGRSLLGAELSAVQTWAVTAMQAYTNQYKGQGSKNADKIDSELSNLVSAVQHTADGQAWRKTVAFIEMVFKGVDSNNYPALCVALGRLGVTAAENIKDNKKLGLIAHTTAALLRNQTDYDGAYELFQRSLSAWQALGDDKGVVDSQLNLALAAEHRGDFAESRRLYWQCIDTFKKMHFEEGIATALHNLGIIAQGRGEYAEALNMFEQSLEIGRKLNAYGPMAATLHSMGIVAQNQSKYAEARQIFEQCLELYKKSNHKQNKEGAALTFHHLSTVADYQGDYEEAKRFNRESMEIARALGRQTGTASCLDQQGVMLQEQGYYDEARPLFKQSLEIERILNDQHNTAVELLHLGIVDAEQSLYAQARPFFEEALAMGEQFEDRTVRAMSLHNLGWLAHQQGHYDEALQLYNESLEIKRTLGNRIGLAHSFRELGRLAHAQGRTDEALPLLQQSLELTQEVPYPLGIVQSLYSLGLLAHDQGKNEDAKRLFQQSLEGAQKLETRSHIAYALCELGGLAAEAGDFAEGQQLCEQALQIFSTQGKQEGVARTQQVLGQIAQQQTHLAAARSHYEQALDLYVRITDPRAAQVRTALANMAE